MGKKISDNKDVILCFLGSKLLFVAILLITHVSYPTVLGLFDAFHYRNIAELGYYHEMMTVFFPVIPLIIRYTGDVGLIVINQIAYLFSLYFLKQILLEMKTKTDPSLVLAVVAVSPMALFTSIEYTESLFMLLTVLVFYLFIKDKAAWLMGLILGLSVLTRNTGSLLFFAVFVGMVIRTVKDKEHIKKRIADILICFAPATLISLIYPVFLQIRFGSWRSFMDAQYDYWIRIKSDVFRTTWISLKLIFTNTYTYDAVDTDVLFKINEVLSVSCLALVVFLIVREILIMRRTNRLNIPAVVAIVYSVLFVIAICMTIREPKVDCPTDSFYRYYAGLFPVYLGIGRFKEGGVKISIIVSVLITLITAPLFCLGSFFY
ncbi:MAG: hypothetical protein J6127_04975 [Clostridiales bacterium]|nr:hypothetical protein [Clostridiales bacterium]